MRKRRALIGSGGHAREVMTQMGDILTCFIDDDYYKEEYTNTFPLSKFDPNEWTVMIAVGDSSSRKSIYERLPANTEFFTYVHHTAQIIGNCKIGEGSFIGANSILTCDIEIGRHSILNRGNHIGHDCEIGDFFSAMPGAIVSGNVKMSDSVYMGTNSSIRENVSITSNVTIGMNSCVIKDVTESGIYVGVPAKIINT